MNDAAGRPTTKTCTCGRTLGRTARTCHDCGKMFKGKHWELDQRKRRERNGLPAALNPAKLPGEESSQVPDSIPKRRSALSLDFDCVATPDGGLDLVLLEEVIHLDARERQIVGFELLLG